MFSWIKRDLQWLSVHNVSCLIFPIENRSPCPAVKSEVQTWQAGRFKTRKKQRRCGKLTSGWAPFIVTRKQMITCTFACCQSKTNVHDLNCTNMLHNALFSYIVKISHSSLYMWNKRQSIHIDEFIKNGALTTFIWISAMAPVFCFNGSKFMWFKVRFKNTQNKFMW